MKEECRYCGSLFRDDKTCDCSAPRDRDSVSSRQLTARWYVDMYGTVIRPGAIVLGNPEIGPDGLIRFKGRRMELKHDKDGDRDGDDS